MATTYKWLDGDTHSRAICQMTKSIQYVAALVRFQCLVVWEMLSHAQTTFFATTVSALLALMLRLVCAVLYWWAARMFLCNSLLHLPCRWWLDCTESASKRKLQSVCGLQLDAGDEALVVGWEAAVWVRLEYKWGQEPAWKRNSFLKLKGECWWKRDNQILFTICTISAACKANSNVKH